MTYNINNKNQGIPIIVNLKPPTNFIQLRQISRLLVTVVLTQGCTDTLYYTGASNPTAGQDPKGVVCYDSDEVPVLVGEKSGRRVCTVDRGLQFKYCTHPTSGLPYSAAARNIKFDAKKTSCIRDTKFKTGARWVTPRVALERGITRLKKSRQVICDFTQYEPFIRYEIDINKERIDTHQGFINVYETPVELTWTKSGDLNVSAEINDEDVELHITHDSEGVYVKTEFIAIRSGDQPTISLSCSIH